jgi:transcriptional regulator with XRE-family HTH domain
MGQVNHFGKALKQVRQARNLSQEALPSSGRTYVSAVERSLKSPTLTKIDAFAEALNVHPLTLLALSYVPTKGDTVGVSRLLSKVEREIAAVLEAAGKDVAS